MKTSKATSAKAQRRFWKVARECIKAFFPDRKASLLNDLQNLRRDVESWPIERIELFFHDEPLYVVYELAGKLVGDNVYKRYLEIRDKE